MAFRAGFFKGTHPGLPGIYNRFVRFWTRGQYSHMVLIFDDGVTGSSTYRGGGVALTSDVIYSDVDWDFINLPTYLEQDARMWFEVHTGKAYDWVANVRFGLGFIPDSKDKWDCASSCMDALFSKYYPALSGYRFEPNSAHDILIALVDVLTLH